MGISYTILCFSAWLRPISSGPPLCPSFEVNRYSPLSPLSVTVAGNDFTGREWTHTIRQRPPSPKVKGQQSHGGVRVCVLEMCVRAVSDQLSLVDSLGDSCVCVWAILRYVRHVRLSLFVCVKYVLFLSVSEHMLVCVYPLEQVEAEIRFWSSAHGVWMC